MADAALAHTNALLFKVVDVFEVHFDVPGSVMPQLAQSHLVQILVVVMPTCPLVPVDMQFDNVRTTSFGNDGFLNVVVLLPPGF